MDSPQTPAYALARRGSPLREAITAAYRCAEPDAVARLRPAATFDDAALARIRSPRRRARRPRPRGALRRLRRRRADERVRPVLGGRHRAHVPRGGAAAHSRRANRRPPHPRQALARRLALARGRQRVPLRERGLLGARGLRKARPRRGEPARPRRGAHRHPRARGRARDPRGDPGGHGIPRLPVRAGRDDRRRAGARAQEGGARLPLLVRHAGRGLDDDGGRRPLRRDLPRGDQRRGTIVRPDAASTRGRASP